MSGFEALMSLTPDGVELAEIRALVEDDLVRPSDVAELLGPEHASDGELLFRREDLPRIRPVLVALAARAAGADAVDGDAQYAAELLHAALLVHDLALGREGGRRRRVARRILKRSVSWLAGNQLTLRALELTRGHSPKVMAAVLETMREFADAASLSRELQEGVVPTYEDWHAHAGMQTGALFSFCCRAGGHLAHADRQEIFALSRYGRHLGRVWHAAQDAAALRHGDGGAHLLTRALAGRPVLAVICAANTEPDIGVAWARLVEDPSLPAAEALAGRVLAAGGLAGAAEIMVREGWSARRSVRRMPESTYRDALEKLAERVSTAGMRKPSL